ncbi:glycosyltransferase 87 family protein [Skermania piniformis]
MLYNLAGFPAFGRPWGSVYHLDLDVYRLAGHAFLSGADVYQGLPATQLGVPLPFVYPPFAAVLFGPGAEMSLAHLGLAMTVLSMVALAASLLITLRSLGLGPAGRLGWATGAAVVASFVLEPVFATLEFGQVNLILLALVAADCLMRRTPWPRGLLIGIAAAVKLTPIVFVLYLLLRRDVRAALVAVAGFAACTALGFLLAFHDSVEFWRGMLDGDQRMQVTAYVGNQSIGAVLLRLGLPGNGMLWLLTAAVVGALTMLGMRRALRGGRTALAFGINGVGGLLVSPVAWSHHWVYAVPLLLALGYEAWRTRSRLLALTLVLGLVMFHFAPHFRIGYWRQDGIGYSLTDQLAMDSYVWWGLALLVVAVSYRARHRHALPATTSTSTGALTSA